MSKHLLNVCQVDSPSGLFITAKILSSSVARGTEVGNDLMSDTILLMRALVLLSGLPMVGCGKWGIFLNLHPPCQKKLPELRASLSMSVEAGPESGNIKLLSDFQPQ